MGATHKELGPFNKQSMVASVAQASEVPPPWIPARDKSPGIGHEVVEVAVCGVTTKGHRYVDVAYFSAGRWYAGKPGWSPEFDGITHWIELLP